MKIRARQVIGRILWIAALAGSTGLVNAQSIAEGERKHGFCASCHGINGRSFKVNYPILAGQAAPYVLRQLRDFKQGLRHDPIMDAIVPQMSEADMRDLAAFFAAQKPSSSSSESDPAKATRGKKIAESAQCASCHQSSTSSSGGQFPRIQGQHRNYMVKQLKDFRDGIRANDGGIMHHIAQALTDADIEDLGNYFASIRL